MKKKQFRIYSLDVHSVFFSSFLSKIKMDSFRENNTLCHPLKKSKTRI
jgi:hypothetical protein